MVVVETKMGDVGGHVVRNVHRGLMHADIAGVVVGRQLAPVFGSGIAPVAPGRVVHVGLPLLDAWTGEVDLAPVEWLDRTVVGGAAYECLQPVDLVLRDCANLMHHEPVNRLATRRGRQ